MPLPNNLSSAAEQFYKLPQQKITQVIILLLLSYVAFILAQLTWLGVSGVSDNATTQLSHVKPVTGEPKQQVSMKGVQALNLFGAFSAQQAERVEDVVIEDAPETSLKLVLTGVVASSNKATAAAIIASAGKQETYSIGESITGTRAVLDNVFSDRVLLKVSGRLETLMFDGLVFDKNVKAIKTNNRPSPQILKSSNQKGASPNVIDQRNNKALTNTTKSLRKELNNDPGKITDYLRISPKRENGKISGYQLMPGKDPTFFKNSGLKSGDVAVQMNGYDLTAPSEAAQALKSLKEQREVSLLLDRNGDMTEILFSIDN